MEMPCLAVDGRPTAKASHTQWQAGAGQCGMGNPLQIPRCVERHMEEFPGK